MNRFLPSGVDVDLYGGVKEEASDSAIREMLQRGVEPPAEQAEPALQPEVKQKVLPRKKKVRKREDVFEEVDL